MDVSSEVLQKLILFYCNTWDCEENGHLKGIIPYKNVYGAKFTL